MSKFAKKLVAGAKYIVKRVSTLHEGVPVSLIHAGIPTKAQTELGEAGEYFPTLNGLPVNCEAIINYRANSRYNIVARGARIGELITAGQQIGVVSRDPLTSPMQIETHSQIAVGVSNTICIPVARAFGSFGSLNGATTAVHFYACEGLIPDHCWYDVDATYQNIIQPYYTEKYGESAPFPENPHPLEFEVVTTSLPIECLIGLRELQWLICKEQFDVNAFFVDPLDLKKNSTLQKAFLDLFYEFVEDVAPQVRKESITNKQLDDYNWKRVRFHLEYRTTRGREDNGPHHGLEIPSVKVLENEEIFNKMKIAMERQARGNLNKTPTFFKRVKKDPINIQDKKDLLAETNHRKGRS